MNIHDAKAQLSTLIERVMLGEEIVIEDAGRPVAKLVPIVSNVRDRHAGSAMGALVVPPDFDEPLPDGIAADWE